MHAVGEVDVGRARLGEHGGVAGRPPPVGVRCRVVLAAVCLYLHDASSDPLARNVSFWADWVAVQRDYKEGRQVGRWKIALEAHPPEPRNCDRRQD